MPRLGIDLADLEIWHRITTHTSWNKILEEEKLGQFNSNNQAPKVIGGSSTESIIVIAAASIANNARSARQSFLD